MALKYPHLFAPGKIGNLKIPNRLVFLPHFVALAPTFGKEHVDYYAERAKGGTGLMIIGSHAVSEEAKMSPYYVDGSDLGILEHYRALAEKARPYGAKVFVQLTHGGHTTLYRPPHILYAPSQMPEPCCHYNTKEMEIEDIKKVIGDFAFSARLVKEGGLDGLEIKGASHDGLLRSFISPYFNHRTDEYGGSFRNRMRLPLEVVAAIRSEVGRDYPLGVRVCMDEFTSWGYGPEQGKEIMRAFEETGQIDYFSCDAGCFSAFYMEIPPTSIPLGFAEYLSAEMKKATDLPVVAFGRINDPVMAERILADGNADFIGMARELVCDPEFANKAREGMDDDIRHCIACLDGCVYQVSQDRPIRCIQHPGTGREEEFGIGTLYPAAQAKRVAVIGGGPAGLKAAEIAARRGHSVSIYEQESEFGGQVNIAAKIPFREEIKDVVRFLVKQLEKAGVNVHLGERMTAEKIEELDADVVIVATGARPAPSSGIPGANSSHVHNVWDVLTGRASLGERVVVYDVTRRWSGLGTAEYVAAMGKKVDAVTPTFYLGEYIEPGNVALAYQRITDRGVNVIPNSALVEIEKDAVTLENVFSRKQWRIENVASVVLSLGYRSVRDIYDRLKGNTTKELHFIGDAVAPRLIQHAVLEAEVLARKL